MMKTFVLGALLFQAACGGAQAQKPPAQIMPEAVGADPAAYQAVAEVFSKKRPLVSQCYGTAIENHDIAETAKGRVKLAMRVLPSGQAEGVRVAETTLGSKPVEDCVVAMVGKWTLPAPDKAIDFIYTYEFSNQ